MAEVEETKNGTVILTCDCGLVHKMKYNTETEQIEIKSNVPKTKTGDSQDNDTKTKTAKRTSIFGNQ